MEASTTVHAAIWKRWKFTPFASLTMSFQNPMDCFVARLKAISVSFNAWLIDFSSGLLLPGQRLAFKSFICCASNLACSACLAASASTP